jgi:hypothetical protein
MRIHLLLLVSTAACYSGARAAPDVDAAWRGHMRGELEAKLGAPASTQPQPDGTSALAWVRHGIDIRSLPSGSLDLHVTPTSISFNAAAQPGVVEKYSYTSAAAVVDPSGRVLQFDSDLLAAGIPAGLNLRTGLVMGLHAGFGALGDATTPFPSGGAYIGGMIGPRLGLVGVYQFVNGKDSSGFAMGHAWGFAVQHWPAARVAIHAGPALVLDLKPGLKDAGLSPGVVGGGSFAFVRVGSLVLDIRLDATASTRAAFGTLGVGVNVN